MTPTWIANNSKLIVNSQIFAVKTPFNTKGGKWETPYEVHPWIAEACKKNQSTWIPNPTRVQFFDAQAGVLERMETCAEPGLVRGDLVKMSFRFVFTIGRTYWHSAIRPMQIIRVGQIASSVYGAASQDEMPAGIQLPKLGDKIILLKSRSQIRETI
jgi:hypothetical protein